MKIRLVFSFIELVEEGAFFGACFIFFFLFDQQFGGKDFPAEVPVVEIGVIDAFVEDLELRDGEAGGQQFEEDGVDGGFVAELPFGYFHHSFMIENEVGHFFDVEPFGMIVGA